MIEKKITIKSIFFSFLLWDFAICSVMFVWKAMLEELASFLDKIRSSTPIFLYLYLRQFLKSFQDGGGFQLLQLLRRIHSELYLHNEYHAKMSSKS